MNDMAADPASLRWLMDWYRDRRGGNWDHFDGLAIQTTYDHGWYIGIDVDETPLAGIHASFVSGARKEGEWYEYELDGRHFHGDGDAGKLDLLIGSFRSLWGMAVAGTLRSDEQAERNHVAEIAKLDAAAAEARAKAEEPPDELTSLHYLKVRELWQASGAMTRDEERRLGNYLADMDRLAGQLRELLRERLIPATLAGDMESVRKDLAMYSIRLWEMQELGYISELRKLIDDITPRIGGDDRETR